MLKERKQGQNGSSVCGRQEDGGILQIKKEVDLTSINDAN
jgi:hypothetical protein